MKPKKKYLVYIILVIAAIGLCYRGKALLAELELGYGLMLYHENKYEDAKTWLKRSAGLDLPEASLMVGVILEKEGKLDEAKQWYLDAANKNSREAQYKLGSIAEQSRMVN